MTLLRRIAAEYRAAKRGVVGLAEVVVVLPCMLWAWRVGWREVLTWKR
jgi:hypothetical protein